MHEKDASYPIKVRQQDTRFQTEKETHSESQKLQQAPFH